MNVFAAGFLLPRVEHHGLEICLRQIETNDPGKKNESYQDKVCFLNLLRGYSSRPLLESLKHITFTLWLFNIAIENGPFIDDFPIKTSIYSGFSMAMLNNQMVYETIHCVLVNC